MTIDNKQPRLEYDKDFHLYDSDGQLEIEPTNKQSMRE